SQRYSGSSRGSRLQLLAGPARGLDLGAGRFAELVRLHRERRADLAVAQDLDRLSRADEAVTDQDLGSDLSPELLQSDQVADIDHRVLGAPDVGEPALGHPADERHLAALETGTPRIAGARLLTLFTASRRLAETRAGPAAHPLARVLAPFGGRQLM